MSIGSKGLFIFVEGTDDERLFSAIVKPHFEHRYDWVSIQTYAQTSPKKTAAFISNIKKMGADYLLIADIDHFPCVTSVKQKLKDKAPSLDDEHIAIVVREIEGWYLAGLDEANARVLGAPSLASTDEIDKERFDSMLLGRYDSRIDLMVEVLKLFSIEIAKKKNSSFRRFWTNHCS